MHRTRTLDYGVVISGSLVLELDDGIEVTLNAGDVLVQRGTIHNWINRSDAPCTVAFILIDALPIVIDGVRLDP
jgi:quercetin dioxygenase-like cupin family protein